MAELQINRGMAEDIARTVDVSEVTRILTGMVRIPSVFDPLQPNGNEREMANFVCDLLDRWEIPYRRWEVAPNRPNIVVDLTGGDGPVLVFEGHMDVVTAGDPAAWSHDPFGAEVVDGCMFGRGTADMKGGLTAMLCAARAIHAYGKPYPGTVRLAILSDEEGMMQGARSFAAEGYLEDAAAAIICEPEGGRVCIAQKGALRFDVSFQGKMAHGCMPDEGANPLSALAEAIVALRVYEAEVLALAEPHPLLGRFSLSPTVVSGGEMAQANVIPNTATLMLDVRTGPEHDHTRIAEQITGICHSAAASIDGVACRVTLLDDRPATETDEDAAIVAAAVAAHEEVFGALPPLGGVPGSTDGTIFWMERKTPLVTWGPGDTTIPHQVNEFVHLDEVANYARAYIHAAFSFFAHAAEADV